MRTIKAESAILLMLIVDSWAFSTSECDIVHITRGADDIVHITRGENLGKRKGGGPDVATYMHAKYSQFFQFSPLKLL